MTNKIVAYTWFTLLVLLTAFSCFLLFFFNHELSLFGLWKLLGALPVICAVLLLQWLDRLGDFILYKCRIDSAHIFNTLWFVEVLLYAIIVQSVIAFIGGGPWWIIVSIIIGFIVTILIQMAQAFDHH